MNSSNDKSEMVTRVQEGEQSTQKGARKFNDKRRSILTASLASGPVIMTITSRPAGAMSGGLYASNTG